MLIPVVSRTDVQARIEWVPPAVAAFELNAYPRVYDWHDRQPIRDHFAVAAEIAGSVPVGFLFVPWGPPWPTGLLEQVDQLLSERLCA
jgi:hypothetical protein